MKTGTLILFQLYFVLLIIPLKAETVVNLPSDSHNRSITLCIGYDLSLLTLRLGYTHSITVSGIDRNLVVDTGLSVPLMTPDMRDFKFNAGMKTEIIKSDSFFIPVSLNFIFRGNSNAAYNALGFGTELGIFPGFYTDKFTAAAEILWDSEWTTHITYSDYYKEEIYQSAVQGWYGFTSSMFRFGGRIGRLIGESDEVFVRTGYSYHGKYNLKIPPFYAVFGNNIRF